ncbi:Putative Phage Tail Protein X [Sulfurovum sp. enrichment culture clone C5]|uniref:Putative Phage Tail Protein X n=1 Tax=Sulfurovum sp. enrichment culture clone C5 TaxID=497650 RepID=A0A0S4XN94_9BACT|nr:Putative Phage Tail Protein X [Sulfurovum sp. enrichment culture clone C5]
MSDYISVDGDRLDTIVYAKYGTLEPIMIVIEANSHILDRSTLSAGVIIKLPEWSAPIKKEEAKTLWN